MAVAIPIAQAAISAYSAYKGSQRPNLDMWSPSTAMIDKYNKYGYRDIARLRREGIGAPKLDYLGMTPGYKAATMGKIRDESQGQQTANEQALGDSFRAYGSPGANSGAYLKALGRLRSTRMGIMSGAARDLELEDYKQRWNNFYEMNNLYGNKEAQLYGQYAGSKGANYNADLVQAQAKSNMYSSMGNAANGLMQGAPGYFDTGSGGGTQYAGGTQGMGGQPVAGNVTYYKK